MFILTLTPGHIWIFVAFATRSSRVPAIGFLPSPKLTFIHDDTKHIPVANTCSNDLHIFVNRIWFDYHILLNGAILQCSPLKMLMSQLDMHRHDTPVYADAI